MTQAQPKPFDANTEANKLYELSKTSPKAFHDEMDSLSKNSTQYNATIKAMEAKEDTREGAFNKAHDSKLHELKIVRSSPNGPVEQIYAQDLSKDNNVERGLPKVHLYEGVPGTAQSLLAQSGAAGIAAVENVASKKTGDSKKDSYHVWKEPMLRDLELITFELQAIYEARHHKS